MTPAYIALGSNLQDPATQLQNALLALGALPNSAIETVSPVYRSVAVGPGVQPDYLNAVALLNTTLSPAILLKALQSIETRQGRVRSERWGPRTLDLDLLLYGQEQIATAELSVPHKAMGQRNFVLYPLSDIAGDNLLLPDGTVLGTLVAACVRGDLVKTNLQLRTYSRNQPVSN